MMILLEDNANKESLHSLVKETEEYRKLQINNNTITERQYLATTKHGS